MRKINKTSILVALLLISLKVNTQSVLTNRFLDNWEVSLGVNALSFYSSNEDNLNLSNSPFRAYRSTIGASLSANKWFTPDIGLRTKLNGYWGRAILGDTRELNSSKFFTLQEQVLFNITNMVMGYNTSRRWDVIPYGGVGLVRNCSYNESSIGAGVGLMGTYKLSDQIKLYTDLGVTFAGDNRKDDNSENIMGRYHFYSFELGVTIGLGRQFWGSKKNRQGKKLRMVPIDLTRKTGVQLTDGDYQKILVEKKAPSGMMLINRGHIRIGTTLNDSLMGTMFPVRDISVDDYFIDRTEVTNAQYRAFVKDVYDSIIAQRAAGRDFLYDYDLAGASLYRTNPVTGEKSIDTKQLIYAYETYDYAESMKSIYRTALADTTVRVYISKDTAYVDSIGNIIRKKIRRPYSGEWDFLNTYVVNIYPDTTCWVNDFPNAQNITYARYYFSHPDYDDYPVVGVSWEQANAYCAWRTERMRREMGDRYGNTQPFRLPTEAEWEYAARAKNENIFPWSIKNDSIGKGLFLANYMADEGDYTADGNIITSQVGTYPSNSFGLYDMAGNVAEWTSTAYTASGVNAMNNVNPEFGYNADMDNHQQLRLKSVKGGSWKDPESLIQSSWRTAVPQESQHSYIGFRCVRSLPTTPTEKTVVVFRGRRSGGDNK